MRRWPLRYQLWIALFAIIIPLAGLLVHTTLSEARASGERVREQNVRLAQLMSATTESFMVEQQRHLQAIAERPSCPADE
ncbi:MAG: hypothetical protein R2856_33320 [Caldilineaceae bacterium]